MASENSEAVKKPFGLTEAKGIPLSIGKLFKACHDQRLSKTHLSPNESDDFHKLIASTIGLEALIDVWNKSLYPFEIVVNVEGEKEELYNLDSAKTDLETTNTFAAESASKRAIAQKPELLTSLAEKLDQKERNTKEDAVQAAASLAQRHKDIEEWLRSTYSSVIASNGLNEKEIQALVYILARVSKFTTETFPHNRTPSRLYDWAAVRSSVTLPYLSLRTAADNLKFDKGFDLKASWGFKDGIVKFPAKESLDADDSMWGRLADLLTVMKIKVDFDAVNDATVPDLGATKIAKNDYFGFVFIRLVELVKSPSSATIRTGSLTPLEIVKNHVDYVLLNIIYQRDKTRYQNLVQSPELHKFQRIVKITREVLGTRGKASSVTSDSFRGYALAQKLSTYVTEEIGKSPEAEPFFRFIFEILNRIAEKVPKTYLIPKTYFAPASLVVRRQLRKGPVIKQKNGTLRGNTYVPFSFVKSSECQEIPETIRKAMTGFGSAVSIQLDSINGLNLEEQNEIIPHATRYINLCYALSDDLRKAWQLRAEIIEDISILDQFGNHDIFVSDKKLYLNVISNISKIVVKTKPLRDDSTKQSELMAQIASKVEARKKSRKTPS